MPALDLAQKAPAPLALSLFAFFPPQSLDSGAGKLTIRVSLDGPRGGLSFKRVYDREAAES